ncbi:conserved hypothetical protein [Nitrosococcus halophilus Nc 4]|uniref:Cytochrome c domain-containing protein n=1 Tax=Nitrosococcus halophilus (strain Nc4) TaxID=472759 RepID=D5C4Y4_NITHN|nr:hypothetical protein [Nitrosococcus halophilus]ADE13407.1 conserved hypothetical protein [Nitrosococcus halophilus Nc 4]
MTWLGRNLCILLLFYLVPGYSSEEFSGSLPELRASLPSGKPTLHRREPGFNHAGSGEKNSAIQRGRDIWFNNTYGGEKFFDFLADRRLQVGFKNVINTPRDRRFQAWGTLNDPDCRANPQGGPDLCSDPNASGVIGIRRFLTADGRTIFGLSCASCHAGFDPLNPPLDVNEPSWDNIHPTIGNQHLKAGKILAANLPADDPRRFMFEGWPDGTVDTTVLFSDHIMNPGTITPIWELRHRPTFNVGPDKPKIRMGQGGEDDLGSQRAALRVYTNIGVCFFECVAPSLAEDRPIDLKQCRRDCADLPPEQDLNDLSRFLRSIKAPKFPESIQTNFSRERSRKKYLFAWGQKVFKDNCASCHTFKGKAGRVLSNDEVNPLIQAPENATNACRALTSQWEADHLWAAFSSQVYKDRAAAGLKGYRTMPLAGIWATAPFLHNQSVGPYPEANTSPEERAEIYEVAMRELLSPFRVPQINMLPVSIGPFPAGTPLTYVFSRDPETNELLCDDIIENRGHYYGSELPEEDKEALIFWLKRQ